MRSNEVNGTPGEDGASSNRGGFGASLRWFSALRHGLAGWIVSQLLSIMLIGGSMGFMGSMLEQAAQHPELFHVLSGALGAMGGFEFLARWAAPLQPS